jgi:hypothetical protein
MSVFSVKEKTQPVALTAYQYFPSHNEHSNSDSISLQSYFTSSIIDKDDLLTETLPLCLSIAMPMTVFANRDQSADFCHGRSGILSLLIRIQRIGVIVIGSCISYSPILVNTIGEGYERSLVLFP